MFQVPPLPDTAPFSPAQRAWLNGFFAALLGEAEAATPAAAAPAPVEDFPWHDPTLELDERLKLAEGRPLSRQLMACMAQLDCGQCGYLCRSYAEAVAEGRETNLSKCVPGAKDTARAVKKLMAAGAAPAIAAASPVASPAPALAPVRFLGAAPLNGAESDKDTRHVVFDLNGSALDYEVGDSLGLQVANDHDLVDATMAALQADADLPVACPDGRTRPLRQAMTELLDIARPSDRAIEYLATTARDADEAQALRALAAGDEPQGAPVDPDLLDLLRAYPSVRPEAAALAAALTPLQARLYSIASSLKAHPGQVHLTVSVVRYQRNGRDRKGVGSTFLAERLPAETEIGAYIQVSHGFRLPASPDTPIVMIGPGTGIAPFRAFLAERRATGAKGRNWLFFGDRRAATDFLYRDELEQYRRDGYLDRLDLAFSRDGSEKTYVQHRMTQSADRLWAWLQDGAHVYVCGDAKHMAKDVDRALNEVVMTQGGRDAAGAKAFVADLAKAGRYQRDVY